MREYHAQRDLWLRNKEETYTEKGSPASQGQKGGKPQDSETATATNEQIAKRG